MSLFPEKSSSLPDMFYSEDWKPPGRSAVADQEEEEQQQEVAPPISSAPRPRSEGRSKLLKIAAGLLLTGGIAYLAIGYLTSSNSNGLGIPKYLTTPITDMASSIRNAVSPRPPPIPLRADMFHVTSISTGKGGLAMMNGRQVTVGDSFTVPVPERNTTVKLRVVKIIDAAVQLSDGSQIFTATISAAQPKGAKIAAKR